MGEAFAMFFIVIAVMAISLVLFGGWVVVTVVRGATRLLGLAKLNFALHHRTGPGHICGRCRRANPPSAHYCRRCGEQL
jgi:ribosomal protein L40E